MKILITGATGFTGGFLLKYLSRKYPNYSITGTGRNLNRAALLRESGFKIITGDLSDPDFVSKQLQGFTEIIHCAALSSPWGMPSEFYSANYVATENLLNGIDTIKKIIYISTPSIYFDFSDRFDIKETDPLPKKFVNNYAATKYEAEQLILSYSKGYLQKVVLRPRAIIGPGDTVIMPRVINAYESGRLKIIGSGKNTCDFTSVENLAHAISLSLEAGPEIDGKVFNITDDNPRNLWDLLDSTLIKLGYQPALKKAPYSLVYFVAWMSEIISRYFTSGEPVLTRYGVGILKYSLTMNIDEAKQHLNYQPITTTEKSIDDFIEYYTNAKK